MKYFIFLLLIICLGCGSEKTIANKTNSKKIITPKRLFPSSFEMFLNANKKNSNIIVLTDKFNASKVIFNAKIKRAFAFYEKRNYLKTTEEIENLLKDHNDISIELKLKLLYTLQICYFRLNNTGAFKDVSKDYYKVLFKDISMKNNI